MTDHIRELAIFLAAAAACFGQTSYTVTPLTAPSGYRFGSLIWIGEDGKTGFGGALQTNPFTDQCMVYQNGAMSLLPTPGLPTCYPLGATAGIYVAQVNTTDGGTLVAFANGSDTAIAPPSGTGFNTQTPVGVNAQGQIADTLICPAPAGATNAFGGSIQCAYLISGKGIFTRLPDLGYGSGATAINASGDVAGWVGQPGIAPMTWQTATHAVVWLHTGTVVDLSNLTSSQIGWPTAINAKGQVITNAASGPSFFYDGVGKISQIQVANASSVYAASLNDNGQVVGSYTSQANDGVDHPFYYFNGAAVDLNAEAPNLAGGAILTSASYIANSGLILVGVAYSSTPQDGPAPTGSVQSLLTPVAAPAQAAPIAASPAGLSFAYQTVGAAPAAQSIQVAATGSAALSFAAAASSAGNWLSVTPAGGLTPASLTVSVSGAGLAAGVYPGEIVITAGTAGNPQVVVPVTLTVIATQTLAVNPTSLNFAYQIGGSAPAAQSIQVTSTDGEPVPFTVQSSNFSFTSVTPTSGTTPATLTVSLSPANILPIDASASPSSPASVMGTGDITLIAGSAGNAQTQIATTVLVTPDVSVSPTSLTFAYRAGGSLPAPQTIQVTALGSGTASFTVTSATGTGNWLSVTPSSGATPGTVTVWVSPAGLTAATYTGAIVINGLDLTVTLTVTGPGPAPAPAVASVVNAASFVAGTSTDTWISIEGANLSTTTRSWTSADFVGGGLPTKLDDVSVTVNGLVAYPSYISPGQINVLAPTDATKGPVQVQVTNAQGAGNSFTVTKSDPMPAFFTMGGQYAAAEHTSGVLVGAPGLVSGATSTPAAPGETVVVFGTGFGATASAVPAGQVLTAAVELSAPITATVGGQPATVVYAGMAANGLDQLNVTIPHGLPDGDAAIVASVSGVSTQAKLYVTIKN